MATATGISLIPASAREEWRRLGQQLEQSGPVPCRTGWPEDWWPDAKAARGVTAHRAVEGCRRCPVSAECLAYALAADEQFGIWGGTLPEERRASRWHGMTRSGRQ